MCVLFFLVYIGEILVKNLYVIDISMIILYSLLVE